MDLVYREPNEKDVIIDKVKDPAKRAYHIDRYKNCLVQFVKELAQSRRVDDILEKYKIEILEIDGKHRVGIELPEGQ